MDGVAERVARKRKQREHFDEKYGAIPLSKTFPASKTVKPGQTKAQDSPAAPNGRPITVNRAATGNKRHKSNQSGQPPAASPVVKPGRPDPDGRKSSPTTVPEHAAASGVGHGLPPLPFVAPASHKIVQHLPKAAVTAGQATDANDSLVAPGIFQGAPGELSGPSALGTTSLGLQSVQGNVQLSATPPAKENRSVATSSAKKTIRKKADLDPASKPPSQRAPNLCTEGYQVFENLIGQNAKLTLAQMSVEGVKDLWDKLLEAHAKHGSGKPGVVQYLNGLEESGRMNFMRKQLDRARSKASGASSDRVSDKENRPAAKAGSKDDESRSGAAILDFHWTDL